MFVYYTLLENKFFDYVVAGCKGTKMPRGDKEWNMRYKIAIPAEKDFEDYTMKMQPIVSYSQSLTKELQQLRSLQTLLTSKLA